MSGERDLDERRERSLERERDLERDDFLRERSPERDLERDLERRLRGGTKKDCGRRIDEKERKNIGSATRVGPRCIK